MRGCWKHVDMLGQAMNGLASQFTNLAQAAVRKVGGYGPVQVDCYTYFVKFTPSITFGLKVAFIKLKHVLLTVNGNLQATVHVSASASGSGSESNENLIASFDASPAIFSIGTFSVKLKVSFPVNAGYSGQFYAGVDYINGKFSRVDAFATFFLL